MTFDDQDWSIVACFPYTGSIAGSLICQGAKEGHKDTPEIDPRSLEEVLTNGCTHLAGWECRVSEMNLQVLPIDPGQHFYLLLHEDSKAWTFALNFRTFFLGALPTCCTTRQCETKSRTYTNNTHFNTFLINPFAIRELSAFIQPKLVANPVRRCQIITHGCFGDFRHEWQWLGFWVGEPKRCAKIFRHCINMLVSWRTVAISHLQILCFQ